jgi:hypothetical protein
MGDGLAFIAQKVTAVSNAREEKESARSMSHNCLPELAAVKYGCIVIVDMIYHQRQMRRCGRRKGFPPSTRLSSSLALHEFDIKCMVKQAMLIWEVSLAQLIGVVDITQHLGQILTQI